MKVYEYDQHLKIANKYLWFYSTFHGVPVTNILKLLNLNIVKLLMHQNNINVICASHYNINETQFLHTRWTRQAQNKIEIIFSV